MTPPVKGVGELVRDAKGLTTLDGRSLLPSSNGDGVSELEAELEE